jgi:hypothetical protein
LAEHGNHLSTDSTCGAIIPHNCAFAENYLNSVSTLIDVNRELMRDKAALSPLLLIRKVFQQVKSGLQP